MYMRRHLCLLGSLLFAGFVTLGACGDDHSSGTGGKGGGTVATGGSRGGGRAGWRAPPVVAPVRRAGAAARAVSADARTSRRACSSC